MPGGIPYIIGNEAAERFSFYGMKGILVVFMTSFLFLLPGSLTNEPISDAKAIEWYHTFTYWVYLTPLFGALLSDILFGKYWTILSLSLVYCLGHGALAFMGTSENIDPALMLGVGLGLIAVGAGGIKPCVSAHVGDQFGQTNKDLLSKVYMWFYFSINVGAFTSTLLTPWVLEWYGPHWAFGIPGVLMLFATFFFWCGRNKFIHVPAGGLKWFKETFSWTGIGALLKLSIIYIFIAVFWALFDQTGSYWVLQAEDMERQWLGIHWLPSQIQAVNPIMILVLIPVFAMLVYPAVTRVFHLTPIRKISIGLFIMVIGFAIIAMIQQWIDAGETPSIGWQILAYAIITAAEVLISITCLEFSYTQAPRTMKSIVMAFFLCSVSFGNYFVAIVANVIQVPTLGEAPKMLASGMAVSSVKHEEETGTKQDPTALAAERAKLAEEKGYTYEVMPNDHFVLTLPGFDAVMGSEDDVKLGFSPEGAMTGFISGEDGVIRAGIDEIGRYWLANGRLPSTEDGGKLLNDLKDEWGQPLGYLYQNKTNFIVSSSGPDTEFLTEYDIRAEVKVTSTHPKEVDASASEGGDDKPKTWLQKRKDELALSEKSSDSGWKPNPGNVAGFERSIKWDIGGGITLTGASYPWFYTWLMLGTAILFVPVGILYRPRTYLQEEGSSSGS
ncbi:MAG: MFS transporter [Phycisphaerae bacterium]|nr:MFS transporter [Phycisphaerae bacterium]|tara:strand:+ start:2547 stop:4556 length:2010 start_codon:yes stop_codon:yes gene_type:complete